MNDFLLGLLAFAVICCALVGAGTIIYHLSLLNDKIARKRRRPLPPVWTVAMDLLKNDRDNWTMAKREDAKKCLHHTPTDTSILWSSYGQDGLWHPSAGWINFPCQWQDDIIMACEAVQEIIAVKSITQPLLETKNETN